MAEALGLGTSHGDAPVDVPMLTVHGHVAALEILDLGVDVDVALAAVEVLASELWPDALSAVVAMPDARKGERLVLVTQQQGATRGEFQSYAKAQHASELMIPSEVWHLEKLPLLGSGKVDMMALTRLVQDRAQPKPELVTRAVG